MLDVEPEKLAVGYTLGKASPTRHLAASSVAAKNIARSTANYGQAKQRVNRLVQGEEMAMVVDMMAQLHRHHLLAQLEEKLELRL